jgi:hypothetical protein
VFATGFNLPVFGLIAWALFYTVLLAASTTVFFWLPRSQAETIGPLVLVAVAVGVVRLFGVPVWRRVRRRIGGPLAAFGAADLPHIGTKAGYLAVLWSTTSESLRTPRRFQRLIGGKS